MSLSNLEYYYQIKSNESGTPRTSTGVSLTSSDDGESVYLAYIGNDDKSVWWMSPTDDLGPNSWLWHNAKVRIQGEHPLLSQIRPAIVIFKGQPTIVTIGMNQLSITVSSFDGAQWQAVASVIPEPADAVCATVLNNHLYIFFTASGSIWQITATDLPPAALSPDGTRFLHGLNGAPPVWSHSLGVCTSPVGKGNVFLFSVPWHSGNASYMFFDPDPNNWNLPAPQTIEPNVEEGGKGLFTRFATFAVLGLKFSTFVYLGKGYGSSLVSADSSDDFTAVPPPPLRLTPINYVEGPKAYADAQLEPVIIPDRVNQGFVYLAHHGAHSGNIWFGHGGA